MSWLRSLRLQRGATQSMIADKAKISLSFYSCIENNRRRPSPDVAKRIAAVLGFPDEWYRLLEIKADGVAAAEK